MPFSHSHGRWRYDPAQQQPPELNVEPAAGIVVPDEIVLPEVAGLRYLQWALARYHGNRKSLPRKLGFSERI